MSNFKEVYKADLQRYGNDKIDKYIKLWTYLFRKCQFSRGGVQKIYHALLLMVGKKHGIEIDYPVQIGKGLFIAHPYGITINDKVVIGQNCNIHKGVTIGQENRGTRKGVPIIGNRVWIGVNATVIGKITIGNDVLIAPNSYVNFDVPPHSIVIGNPGNVIFRENATEGYINNLYYND